MIRAARERPWPPLVARASKVARRLGRMSVDEWRVRSAQTMRKYAELVLNLDQGEYSDRRFRRMLTPDRRGQEPGAIVAQWLRRMRSAPFMPGLADRRATIRLMEGRFAAERTDLLARAGRAMQGRFDLLGLRDLSFGDPIDWSLEPLSGKRTGLAHWSRIPYLDGRTVGDKKIVWELNRHAHFVTLGQAYWLTEDERYAEAFVRQCTAWMDANPPRRGINWASSLEISFRSIAWLWALHLFAGSDRLTTPFVWRVLKALAQHASYIESYLSHYFAPNTHLTGEALGLYVLGIVLPLCQPAAGWRTVGSRVLVEQLERQVRPDGVYFEQSSYYHRYTTDFYLHLMLCAGSAGTVLPTIVPQTLRGLLDHLCWITRPDGLSTLYGDDDGGRLVTLAQRPSADFRDTLQAGAALFGRSDWKCLAGPASVELLWLMGADGLEAYDSLDSAAPDRTVRHFAASGNVVLRDGWHPDASYVFLDSGPYGAVNCVHAHADALSVEFAAEGIAWIVDPGTYTYTKDPAWRDYFRGTAAHNTVVIDGLPQAVPAGPFSWMHVPGAVVTRVEVTEEGAVVEGEHNGYERLAEPVRHRRLCHLLPRRAPAAPSSYLVLQDRISTAGTARIQARLHLAPDCHASIEDGVARVTHAGGKELLVAAWRLAPDGTSRRLPIGCEAGWVSSVYGRREPATVLTMDDVARGGSLLTTLLVPCCPGEPPDLEALLPSHRGASCFSSSC